MWTIYNSHSSIQYVRCTFYDYICINSEREKERIARIPILIKIILLFVFAIELVSNQTYSAHSSRFTDEVLHKCYGCKMILKLIWHCGCVSMSYVAKIEPAECETVKHEIRSKVHTNIFQFANIDFRTENSHFQFSQMCQRHWKLNAMLKTIRTLKLCECVRTFNH